MDTGHHRTVGEGRPLPQTAEDVGPYNVWFSTRPIFIEKN